MAAITVKGLRAREMLDSRGNPTVEVTVATAKGRFTAGVPSGASTGTHEALELRDGDKGRYGGKGVLKAVGNVNGAIAKRLVGRRFASQGELDSAMLALDGTPLKSKLGANAILGVSMAGARAFAAEAGTPLYRQLGKGAVLPVPYLNVVNGSSHAGNDLAIQEFMLAPAGLSSFSEAMRAGSEAYHALKANLKAKYGKGGTNVGDEGGFAPQAKTTREVLDLLVKSVEDAGYRPGSDIHFGIDAAASVFFSKGRYEIDGRSLTEGQLVDYYFSLMEDYPILSFEDPFDEEAWGGFAALVRKVDGAAQVVGDDLLVTNPERIAVGIKRKSCTALLLKPNQIGTVTEATEACRVASKAGWNVMVSHRSGETPDAFIADLVVGLGTGQIKTGAPARGERVAKYNRLMEIEEELGKKAAYGQR